jgi:predicted DNA-binding protein
MDNIRQDEVMTFKASTVIKSRLEKLSKREGVSGAGFLRDMINREYKRVFGEVE